MEPTTPTPAAAAPTPTAPAAPVFTPELNPSQAETMAGWIKADLAANKISAEQAAKSFDELNVPMDQRTDTRTDAAKELDDAGLAPAKPDEFVIHYGVEAQSPELKQFDTAARTWLHGAAFPRELGNSLVTTIGRVAQQTAKMTPDQLATYGQTEYAKLQRTYGDGLEAKLQAAARMVHVLDTKKPGLKNLLKAKGIGDNAMVAKLLIDQSERYWARRQ